MKYIKALYAGFIGLLLTACQAEQWEGTEGGFQISLGEDVTVTTKSTPAELGKPVKEQFSLKIVKESTGSTLYDGTFTSDQIPASAGLYTVTGTCGDNPLLGLDTPYYKGEEAGVEVTEGETRTVNLSCKVANALTSVTYEEPEKFDALFSSYGLKVSVDNQFVTINNNNAQKSAYYRAGTIPTFQFVGTLKDNGQAVSMTLEDDKLKDADTFGTGKHCKLTLKVKPATSGVILTVAKVEVENVTISETIPVEWLPAPKISATGFDENKTLTIYETAEAPTASIDFTVSRPIQDMSFSLNFSDENFLTLNKDYSLSTLSDEDRIKLTNAGISLPIIGSSSPQIIFSEDFTSKLLAKNEGVAYNQITINSVTANNRTNTDGVQTYTIAVHKPIFTVSVLPGNIWTKEFTIEEISVEEGKGNLEKIKENLIYQYQENGEWKDCSNQETRQQIFIEHPLNRNYKVRAIYRGALISNEVDIEMESQEQLVNSDMEAWHQTDSGWDAPNYIPRNSSNEEEYWDTNNEFTFRYNISSWFKSNYNGFPAVSYSTAYKHGGNRSAELRNTAAGPVNTGSVIYDNNKVAGMLFYGNYTGTTSTSAANGSISIDEGRTFNSRPTQISFWYIYEPYNGDKQDTYEVIVKVIDASGNIIGEGHHTSNMLTTSWTNQTINITYQTGYIEKASKIYVCFLSSNAGQGNVPYEKKREISLSDAGNYTTHYGSILRIDDISLIYDK